MDTLNFSYNWNGSAFHFKIHNKYFTTMRLRNPERFAVGKEFNITFKNKFVKKAKIIMKKSCKINDFSDMFFFLDTGYSKEKSIDMIKKMYKLSNEEICFKLFDVIMFETVKT